MVTEKERKIMIERRQRELDKLRKEFLRKDKQLTRSYSGVADKMDKNRGEWSRKANAVLRKYEKYLYDE